MTPAQAIAMLDRQLAVHGQSVSFKHGTDPAVATTGFVRGYDAEQLVGLITQADRNVIVSPSDMGGFAPADGDAVLINGDLGTVTQAEAILIGDTLVRWNIVARMA